LEKNEVILGVDCDGDDDNSAFSCFLLFFLRGEGDKGKEDGVTDCCDQIKNEWVSDESEGEVDGLGNM
jgi:hypothetical protein